MSNSIAKTVKKRREQPKYAATPGRNYKRLTVAMMRRHYKSNPGQPIFFVANQEFRRRAWHDDNMAFIADGSLVEIHETSASKRGSSGMINTFGKKRVKKNWLAGKEPGPYKQCLRTTYYFLGGKIALDLPRDVKDYAPYELQVCARPMNALSTDCLDSVDCWVKK